MKNLHLIATDKPSRLLLSKRDYYQFLKDNASTNINNHFEGNYQHIYITSDEEIKEGDWYLNTEEKNGVMNPFYGKLYIANHSIKEVSYDYMPNLKKIILTTDVDLIKDDVQPIDDEFLEWFIKNPSCEFVEILIKTKTFDKDGFISSVICDTKNVEKIYSIIPQEEPCSFCEGTGQIVSSTTISGFKTCDCINILQEEPKQTDEKGNPLTFWGGLKKHKKESIEEEAELFAKSRVELDPIYANGLYYGFIQCGMSKWFEAEKIKAQIEENLSVLEMLEIHGTESSIFRVKMRIKQLEKELKTDDNGLD
jgi:hypothetical protein